MSSAPFAIILVNQRKRRDRLVRANGGSYSEVTDLIQDTIERSKGLFGYTRLSDTAVRAAGKAGKAQQVQSVATVKTDSSTMAFRPLGRR
jgi:uncharacterized spore protein YtfJ